MNRFSAALVFIAAAVIVFVAFNGGVLLTGRPAATPLTVSRGGPAIPAHGRIWIDTDAACGATPRTDPDDCFAIVWLLSRGVDVAGISISFGNAPGDVVADTVTGLLATLAGQRLRPPPVFIGNAAPITDDAELPSGAAVALQAALAEGPLTILALGPLTNIASALRGRRDLQANVTRLVAVMGHRPGHQFHPTKGNGQGAVWGDGPIFRDLNVAVDQDAVSAVLAMNLPITLIPYDAATGTVITGDDLDVLVDQSAGMAYASQTARGWLAFWNDDVGLPGFYPFDWDAAAYMVHPLSFDCAVTEAAMAREWTFWLMPRQSLLIAERRPDSSVAPSFIIYCPQAASALHYFLMASRP